jgi:hypothetical protein
MRVNVNARSVLNVEQRVNAANLRRNMTKPFAIYRTHRRIRDEQ